MNNGLGFKNKISAEWETDFRWHTTMLGKAAGLVSCSECFLTLPCDDF